MFKKRNIGIIISLMFLLMILPSVYAMDNNTGINQTDNDIGISTYENDALTVANDYYFDSSSSTDGDGSIDNPYKYLYASRIRANSNLHFANGQYSLDTSKSIEEVNIIGSEVDKTIINFDGVGFSVNNALTVKNVTFVGLSVTNYAKFTAYNSIFKDAYGCKPDSYGNNYGGAVYTYDQNANAYVNIDNCTFIDNYAVYGGAIYMGNGVLNVNNSLFYNNYAHNFGGSIACEVISNITVSNSKFYNSRSLADAGGAIYIKSALKFIGSNIEVINSTATFGGAITTLNTNVAFSALNMVNNSAKYDGGSIYHMYGNFTLVNSNFNNNSANNGGALFIDNSTSLFVRSNIFTANHANNTAGAIYSLLNKLNSPFTNNRFISNTAGFKNDYYDVSDVNLTIGSGNYTMYVIETDQITNLPTRYSLIDEGYVTPVKDQQTSGNCWAFTAIAVIESCILKASGVKLDLSEENMKNLIALYSDYGWKIDTNDGGLAYMPWAYLSSWLGPVNEIDDLFDDKSTLSSVLNSVMHIQNIKFIYRSNYLDNDEIKKAILNYGAVGTTMYYDSGCFNYLTSAYCCYGASSGNHAVTIVGWDDNYKASNFKYGGPEGNGAWIVRNSWNDDWGDNGYFYVSYYDRSFALDSVGSISYTIILNDTIKFDKNYQYDISGVTDYFYNASSQVWYKNVFTASCDEFVAAVSTYFEKTTNWTASVLVNGQLKDVISGIANAGYYTFNLNKLIPIKTGDVFEVVFNVTIDGGAGFPISEKLRFNKMLYSPGISFVSYDGENWSDLYDLYWRYSTHVYNSQVAAIKAFTVLNPINTSILLNVNYNSEENLLNITATLTDEYGNLLKYGNVTFTVNGQNQTVDVENGKATLLYNVNQKTNYISAIFNAEGYNQSVYSISYTVPKISIKWNVSFIKNNNDVDIIIRANKLLNESVLINISGNESFIELVNGSGILKLINLTNGVYPVYISLLNTSDYEANPLTGEFLINVLKTKIISNNITVNDAGEFIYNVTLVDEDNNTVSGREIVFTIANATYKNLTDVNGISSINIKLNKGIYDVDIVFVGDDDYFKSDAKNSINVKGKIFIDLEAITYKNNAFINIYGSKRINETFFIVINNETQQIDSKNGYISLKLYNLSNGIYNISVSLNESEYEFNDANSQFTIQYRQSTGVYSNITISGRDAIIDIKIENASGNVSVVVDGIADSVELNNSQARYVVKNIHPGNHSLVIICGDEEEFYKSEVFSVAKIQSTIDLILNNTKIGEKSVILVDITPGASGLVSIDINGSQYFVNLSKTNKLELYLNKVGQYSVVATYLGDDYYSSSKSDKYNLTVLDKSQANVSVEMPKVIHVGDTAVFKISKNTTSEVKIYINGVIQNITNDKFNFTSLKADLYILTIVAGENEDYYAFEESILFNVIKNDAFVLVNLSDNILVGENITIKPVTNSDGQLNVSVNGQLINSSYVVPFKGAFVIEVKIAESDRYNSASYTTTFTSHKHPTNVTLDIDTTNINGKVNLKVNVCEGAGGNVIVNVNGTDYLIDLNKTDLLELNLNNPGTYRIYANYLGDYRFESNTSDIYYVELKDNSNIEIPAEISSESKNMTIHIEEDNGEVYVNIDGKVNVLSLVNKTVNVDLTNLSEGNHNISVIYFNENTHEMIYKAAAFTLLNELTDTKFNILGGSQINIYAVDYAAGERGQLLSFKLTDLNNNPIKNAEVKFSYASKTLTKTTNDKGIVYLDAGSQNSDKYSCLMSFAGDKIYKGSSVSFTINIVKKPISIKAKSKTFKAKSKSKKYTITLKTAKCSSKDGKTYLKAGKKITLKLKSKTYTAKTNKKGNAVFKLKITKKGKYNAVIKFKGDKTYNSASKKVKIKIK